MLASVIEEIGGPEVLRWKEMPDPTPGPDEVLIGVEVAGVNFRDIYFRRGVYTADLPYIPGLEAAGVVRAAGANVKGLVVGDRVVASMMNGSYAEQAVASVHSTVKVPDSVTLESAAGLMLQGLTAHVIATSAARVAPGDWVVVHAAAGGLGLLLTRMLKHLGAKVIGTVSSPEKAAAAREAGVDVIASYDDFVEVARRETGGAGASVVFDGVGAATFANSIEALHVLGTMVLFGIVSGPVPTLTIEKLRSRTFIRPGVGDFLGNGQFGKRMAELFDWHEKGVIRTTIGARFPMSRAGEAQEALESRKIIGKVLIIPDDRV